MTTVLLSCRSQFTRSTQFRNLHYLKIAFCIQRISKQHAHVLTHLNVRREIQLQRQSSSTHRVGIVFIAVCKYSDSCVYEERIINICNTSCVLSNYLERW